MCDRFTVPNVKVVAQAIAERIIEREESEKGLVIAYDTRFFSEKFARACAEVFAGNGITIHLPARSIPTPIAAYAINSLETAGGVMITASHNPAEYNGIKFIADYGGPAFKDITDDIEKRIEGVVSSGRILQSEECDHVDLDVIPRYLVHLERLVDFDRLRTAGLKVALDPLFGAGHGILDVVFASAGCDLVETIHNCRDPLFGGSKPDPTKDRLSELSAVVLDKKADLGLAVDGDGDRFGAVDYDGSYVTANQCIAIMAMHLVKNRGKRGKIVRTVATTHLLDAIASDFGCELIETPVGFKHIAAEMLSSDVVIGGEESGGISIGGHVPEKDGILADLLLAEAFAYEEKPLLEILEDIMEKYGVYHSERIDVPLRKEEKRNLIQRMKSEPPDGVGGTSLAEIKAIDGVKYVLENGDWILARPSGTEPLVRIYIESKSEEGLNALKNYARTLL